MYCPYCHKLHQCGCSNCDPNGVAVEVAIIHRDEGVYECYFCHQKFHEGDSLDYEWNEMIKSFSERISPEMAIKWVNNEVDTNENFAYESAFRYHFGIRHDLVNIKDLKLSLKRDNILKGLL